MPSSKEANVEIIKIGDSRCPQDVVCIWAGQVLVSFKLPTNAVIELCIAGDSNCTSSINFDYYGETYQLTLLGVTPYPTTENTEAPRTVEFTLIKK